jgi:hypothetical protein
MGMNKFSVVLVIAFVWSLFLVDGRLEARPRVRAPQSVSLAGVTPVLATKAREIEAECGSVIISAVSQRPNRSDHPTGRAVDIKGNPDCIYAHLKGWPGGYSTDYGAVQHVHISYKPGGREWGLHFTHNRPHRVRYARHGLQPPLYASHNAY